MEELSPANNQQKFVKNVDSAVLQKGTQAVATSFKRLWSWPIL